MVRRRSGSGVAGSIFGIGIAFGAAATLTACNEKEAAAGPTTGPNGEICDCQGAACGQSTCGSSCGECGDATYCSEGACQAADSCDITGFTTTTLSAIARVAAGQTRVRIAASNVVIEPPFDKVVLEINLSTFWNGAPPAAGSYDLKGSSEVGAALFMRGYTYCKEVDCAFTYVVDSGTLEIAADGTGAPGTPFHGRLRGVTLKQVRVDATTGELKPFASGKTWCLGDLRINVDVPTVPTAQGNCVAEGTGKNIGENIRNFTLMNCFGDPVDLHSACGKAKAVWLIASAGWCGACSAFVPVAAERHNELADQGLDLWVVLGEDSNSAPPSLAYCKAYAAEKGIDPAATFVDNDGQGRSWAILFDALNTYTTTSIGLPWNAVLDGRNMVYVWSSTAGEGDLYQAQDALLSAE